MRGTLGVTIGLAKVGGTVGGGTACEGGIEGEASEMSTGENTESDRDQGRGRDRGKGKDRGQDHSGEEGIVDTLVHLHLYLKIEGEGIAIDPRRSLLVVHPHPHTNIAPLPLSNRNLANHVPQHQHTLIVPRLHLLLPRPNYLRRSIRNTRMLFHSAPLLFPNTILLLVPLRHSRRTPMRRPEMHPRFRSLELRGGCWEMAISSRFRRREESNCRLREVLRDLETVEELAHRLRARRVIRGKGRRSSRRNGSWRNVINQSLPLRNRHPLSSPVLVQPPLQLSLLLSLSYRLQTLLLPTR